MAIKKIEEQNKNSIKLNHEMGVLEKLLKIDRNGAIVMASDMLMAGIDTVNTFFFVFCISILILFLNSSDWICDNQFSVYAR